MSDFKLDLIQEITEQTGAVLFAGRCPDCSWPLIEFKDQRLPFCWMCTVDRITAERGRNLLERLKRGITITRVGEEAFWHEDEH